MNKNKYLNKHKINIDIGAYSIKFIYTKQNILNKQIDLSQYGEIILKKKSIRTNKVLVIILKHIIYTNKINKITINIGFNLQATQISFDKPDAILISNEKNTKHIININFRLVLKYTKSEKSNSQILSILINKKNIKSYSNHLAKHGLSSISISLNLLSLIWIDKFISIRKPETLRINIGKIYANFAIISKEKVLYAAVIKINKIKQPKFTINNNDLKTKTIKIKPIYLIKKNFFVSNYINVKYKRIDKNIKTFTAKILTKIKSIIRIIQINNNIKNFNIEISGGFSKKYGIEKYIQSQSPEKDIVVKNSIIKNIKELRKIPLSEKDKFLIASVQMLSGYFNIEDINFDQNKKNEIHTYIFYIKKILVHIFILLNLSTILSIVLVFLLYNSEISELHCINKVGISNAINIKISTNQDNTLIPNHFKSNYIKYIKDLNLINKYCFISKISSKKIKMEIKEINISTKNIILVIQTNNENNFKQFIGYLKKDKRVKYIKKDNTQWLTKEKINISLIVKIK